VQIANQNSGGRGQINQHAELDPPADEAQKGVYVITLCGPLNGDGICAGGPFYPTADDSAKQNDELSVYAEPADGQTFVEQ